MRGLGVMLVVVGALAACSPASQPEASAPAAPAAQQSHQLPPEPAAVASAEPVALEITDASGAQMTGDPEKGRRAFGQCASCHALEAGVNRVGPTLHGIIGRHSGTAEGFNFSPANRASGIVWTEQELFAYLENPRTRIPGTIMAYAGMRNPQQRADLIAYLKTASQ